MGKKCVKEGPNIISDAKEKAEVLNDYFCSQSTIDDGAATIPNDIIPFQSSVILSNVIATEYEINSLLRGVDTLVKHVVPMV
jgi:hypothetical protein